MNLDPNIYKPETVAGKNEALEIKEQVQAYEKHRRETFTKAKEALGWNPELDKPVEPTNGTTQHSNVLTETNNTLMSPQQILDSLLGKPTSTRTADHMKIGGLVLSDFLPTTKNTTIIDLTDKNN